MPTGTPGLGVNNPGGLADAGAPIGNVGTAGTGAAVPPSSGAAGYVAPSGAGGRGAAAAGRGATDDDAGVPNEGDGRTP